MSRQAEIVTLTPNEFGGHLARYGQLWIRPLINAIGDLIHINIEVYPIMEDEQVFQNQENTLWVATHNAIERVTDAFLVLNDMIATIQHGGPTLNPFTNSYHKYLIETLKDTITYIKEYNLATMQMPVSLWTQGARIGEEELTVGIWDFLNIFVANADDIDWSNSEDLVLWLYNGAYDENSGLYTFDTDAVKNRLGGFQAMFGIIKELNEVAEGAVYNWELNKGQFAERIDPIWVPAWEKLEEITRAYQIAVENVYNAFAGLVATSLHWNV
ncbi:hypothetical protein ABW20_dc0108245 [Dactylellina cionopaga]|nr:hypothetical protein ABW20_dc0108245 [Dactylellina cionopaga]